MILHVLKKPASETLAQCVEADDNAAPQSGWEAMTAESFAAWKAAELAAGWAPPPAPEPVPATITNAQCRVMLVRQGIDPDNVLALIEGITDPVMCMETKARWEYANHIHRNEPSTIALAAMLGFDSSQLDALFREAEKIP